MLNLENLADQQRRATGDRSSGMHGDRASPARAAIAATADAGRQARALRLGMVSDFVEEGWPSMDVCREMLSKHVEASTQGQLGATDITPPFRRRLMAMPVVGRSRMAFNADRLCNRFVDLPRAARRASKAFDAYHVVDHSYAQVVRDLPGERTGVYCHDLDAFKSLFEGRRAARSAWRRSMAAAILDGLKRAAVVFFSTHAVRERIESLGLVDGSRLVHAPYGVSPEYTSAAGEDDEQVCAAPSGAPFLLHVGSCIPRKRIDVLLSIFAEVRRAIPDLHLVQIGGQWTEAQRTQIDRLGLSATTHQRRGVSRGVIASHYRRAALVLQPSEAEGFGLPVIEALACGAVVLASDIAVLREVGGEAAVYCAVGDVDAWSRTTADLLTARVSPPSPRVRQAHAARYTWSEHARTIGQAYLRLLDKHAVATVTA